MGSNLPPGVSVSDLPGSEPQREPGEPVKCRHCGEVDPDDHGDGCPQERAEELSDQAWDYHRERQLEELGVDPEQI